MKNMLKQNKIKHIRIITGLWIKFCPKSSEEAKLKYILGAKPGDHKFLFQELYSSEDTEYHEQTDENGTLHQFYFLNNVALNKSNQDVKVNVLEYRKTDHKGQQFPLKMESSDETEKSIAIKN